MTGASLLLVVAAAGALYSLFSLGIAGFLLVRNVRDPEAKELGVTWRMLFPVRPAVAFAAVGVVCLVGVCVLLVAETPVPGVLATIVIGGVSLVVWSTVVGGAMFSTSVLVNPPLLGDGDDDEGVDGGSREA